MGNDHNTAALQCKLLLIELLRDVRRYLVAESHYESYAEQVGLVQHMQTGPANLPDQLTVTCSLL
jgi:hypothetical protein